MCFFNHYVKAGQVCSNSHSVNCMKTMLCQLFSWMHTHNTLVHIGLAMQDYLHYH